MKKNVLIKVYDNGGTFLTTWKDAKFEQFTKEINGGLGECIIEFGKVFDYSGSDLQVGNNIEIIISDSDTVGVLDGYKIIYSGYISMINPWIKGNDEGVTVHILGHYTKLALDVLKNGTQTTLYSDSSAGLTTSSPGSLADVGLIMRGIITRYRAETTNPKINYDTLTIPLSSTNGTYKFEMKTYREAMDKVKSIAPSNWYYYINEVGMVYFKSKPTTATHKFIFGKHFSSINVEYGIEKVRNVMLFWNKKGDAASVYKSYTDSNSISLYGRRVEKYFDSAVTSTTESGLISTKFLAENKNPDAKVICEIVDNNEDSNKGYDIESINPGDTCSFFGFDSSFSSILKENMIISRIVYSLNKVELTIENILSSLVDLQADNSKAIDDINATSVVSGSPTIYS